ncbi:MAG: hypothetical protein GWP05_07645, partial [Anaerolineaceae bacterium]|nr:hypothetical protein [Anaerolineaceae bacterium]
MPTVVKPADTGDDKSYTEQEKRGDWLVRQFNAEPRTLNPMTSKDVY